MVYNPKSHINSNNSLIIFRKKISYRYRYFSLIKFKHNTIIRWICTRYQGRRMVLVALPCLVLAAMRSRTLIPTHHKYDTGAFFLRRYPSKDSAYPSDALDFQILISHNSQTKLNAKVPNKKI